jgi:predicted naringenin-chalcone synthase
MYALHSFQLLRPEYESTQEAALEWLVQSHTQAESKRCAQNNQTFDSDPFATLMRKALERFGCNPKHIGKRGHVLKDYCPGDETSRQVFGPDAPPEGWGIEVRTRIFENTVDAAFQKLYEQVQDPPEQIIHVTCTGYVSPSGAQKLVSQKHWHTTTRVMHAYQMGCSAAIPALRIARGLLAAEPMVAVDIVHTELCTLHLNPALHSPEQLVVQSLFADGMIRYQMGTIPDSIPSAALEILSLVEEMAPDSLEAMAWRPADWGMRMVLSAEIPKLIAERIGGFVEELFVKAGIGDELANSIFAIHPGGPKILEFIREKMGLDPVSLRFSRAVLHDYGNMSSATLPHIWARILETPTVPDGTPIVSLAFGPGLTICGALLRKRSC